MRLKCLKGQSIGQVILAYEQEADGQSEPYFRHFSRVWNRDPTIEKWELCVHQHMFQAAKTQYKKIISDLIEKHGDEIYQALDTEYGHSYAAHAQQAEEIITFDLDDDDDMYMAGKGNFQFQGIELVNKDQTAAAALQKMHDDAATSVGFSEHEHPNNQPPGEDHTSAGWQEVIRNRKTKHKPDGQSPTNSPSSTHAAKGR